MDANLDKVDSALLDLARLHRRRGSRAALAAARERDLLNSLDELLVTLVLTDTDRAPAEDRIGALGGRVVAGYEELIDLVFPLAALIAGRVEGGVLADLAALPNVREVRATPRLLPLGGDLGPA